MPDQPDARPPNATGTIVTAAILSGAVMIALIGTFVSGWIGLSGTPAIALQLAFYAVAALDVAIAFWLRAKLRKARNADGGAVQRQ
jgi:membrane protein implicated in regulation of membrane protease activity